MNKITISAIIYTALVPIGSHAQDHAVLNTAQQISTLRNAVSSAFAALSGNIKAVATCNKAGDLWDGEGCKKQFLSCHWVSAKRPSDTIMCADGELMSGIRFEHAWEDAKDSHIEPEVYQIRCCK